MQSQTRQFPAIDTNHLQSGGNASVNVLKGDSTTAILARHHIYTGNRLIAQLGYIDSTVASVKEVLDNLLIGLVVLPGDDYEIVSYSFSAKPKDRDLIGPFTVIANHVKTLRQIDPRPGDRLYFDNIRARRKGSDHTVPIKDGVCIKITR